MAAKSALAGLALALAAVSANANNVAVDVIADSSANPIGYVVGEIVRVSVRLRAETTPITSLELAQVDLRLTNATLVPEFDPNDGTNPITDPVIFGGAAAGDGQMPPGGDPQDWDGYPGPPLPGCPASCLVGSIPSAQGGGTIYFWLRTSTSTAHLLSPPTTMPGRLFIQFKIQFTAPGTVIVDALGPAVDDGSSSGAFFQQPGTATIWCNGDADSNDNITGGILQAPVQPPEPASLSLLGIGALVALRRRRPGAQLHPCVGRTG